MHVAVCIVGFRNPHDIVRCLDALSTSTYVDFEVLICENGGPEAFRELSALLPPKLPHGQELRAVLASGNLGYAGGVNRCLDETPTADAWWILNPDTQPSSVAMSLQVSRLLRGDCEAVGSTIYLADGRVQSHGGRWRSWLARAESIGFGSDLSVIPSMDAIEKEQNYLNGASMMVSRRFVDAYGRMREDYFLYCEEVEWCLRAMGQGARLGFAADAHVLHYAGTTTGSYDDITRRPRAPVYLNERNKLLTTRDRFPLLLPVAALASLALIFLRFARQGAWRQVGYALSGWLAGMANRRGRPDWLGD
ncbi:glycosyltransferase family 2 protein [Phenylobacterium sp. Root700]|uniref:glycosyltransferase family 2 protein n=1 Tax=Phenylobacterium sp. Root700 TaxID=1736591 RepID=UPI0009EB9C86|nr:glycosyltransferase family 2 protein [Phenylobacterium sp. Root700]